MDSAGALGCPSPDLNTIRWRKGELIGAGAFGSVYMGMNLDSGELLAVKQVLIAAKNVARDKSQAHLRELEEEVKLLQNLSHPHIVRYLGTAREDGALNIFLEFVPGGSIASLLTNFGSFPEAVIRTYSRQLLQGLEYLHKNGIMHRDIKGANILVDNKGCIKLADFGASKQVVELVTISGAKSMKGTPYWMAPEVIRQTGHSLPADIWSVGCTIIEMATGKAPWSQQFQEVAALFHIGTTKSHPPIPDHLSREAQDFLRKCLRKEPHLRPSASELLKHPFINSHPPSVASDPMQDTERTKCSQTFQKCRKRPMPLNPLEQSGTKRCASMVQNASMKMNEIKASRPLSPLSDNLCFFRDSVDVNCSVRLDWDSYCTKRPLSYSRVLDTPDLNPSQGFPDVDDGWCNLASPELKVNKEEEENLFVPSLQSLSPKSESDFSFQCCLGEDENYDDDDEVTESKIKAFLDEKALELKKLQTPLYIEFRSICNVGVRPQKERIHTNYLQENRALSDAEPGNSKLVSESLMTSPSSVRSSSKKRSLGALSTMSSSHESEATVSSESPRLNELKRLLLETQQPLRSPSSLNSTERQRKWKEELQQELDLCREERKLSARSSSVRKLATMNDRSPFQSPSANKLRPTLKSYLMNPMTADENICVTMKPTNYGRH